MAYDLANIMPTVLTEGDMTQLRLVANTPTGGITKSVKFSMTTEYDRPWLAWYDESDRLRVGAGYHTRNYSDGAYHEAYEIKTSDDPSGGTPNNMATRFSVGTDAEFVPILFNECSNFKIRYDGTTQFELDCVNKEMNLGDGTNTEFRASAGGGRCEFGYNGGSAFFSAGSTKAAIFYSNAQVSSPQITLGTGGELQFSTLAAPSSASDTGTAGEIRIDGNFIYICTATDTWKRAAIATW